MSTTLTSFRIGLYPFFCASQGPQPRETTCCFIGERYQQKRKYSKREFCSPVVGSTRSIANVRSNIAMDVHVCFETSQSVKLRAALRTLVDANTTTLARIRGRLHTMVTPRNPWHSRAVERMLWQHAGCLEVHSLGSRIGMARIPVWYGIV